MKKNCCSCQRPKANYVCPLCEQDVCKACAQFLDEASFAFLPSRPSELSHSLYCPRCFDDKVAGPLAEYEAGVEKARQVAVFMKNESKRTRLFPRKETPVVVIDCLDEDETILRLAFLAAQDNYNAIIDVDLKSEKVISGSHKYTKWKGTAMPCNLEERQLRQEYYD